MQWSLFFERLRLAGGADSPARAGSPGAREASEVGRRPRHLRKPPQPTRLWPEDPRTLPRSAAPLLADLPPSRPELPQGSAVGRLRPGARDLQRDQPHAAGKLD